MSTIWHCNKERKRNTHLRVQEASWNIASLLRYLKSVKIPPPLTPASHSGYPFWRFGDSIWRFSMCESRQIQAPYGGGGGLAGFFPNTQELVFWLFLLSYLTSGPFSCWYFLLLKQRFFWYYFSCQVMAILCCVAQKAAKQLPRHRDLGAEIKKYFFFLFGPDTYHFMYAGNSFQLWVITQKKVVSDS
jgi:hypothetical protein